MTKYIIKSHVPSDPLFQPWDIVVESKDDDHPLVVQEPSPFEHDNLLGFEVNHGDCDVFVRQEGWEEECIGMSPVFVRKGGGIYSVPGTKITKVMRQGT